MKQRCVRIACKCYHRKEHIHGGKERFKKQNSPVIIDVWITLGHEMGCNSQACVL